MELQFALLIAGIALVALVVIASVFPAVGEKLRSALSQKGKPTVPVSASASRHERAAPRFEGDDSAVLG